MGKGKQKIADMLVDFSEVAAMREDMAIAAESILSAMAHMEQVCGVSEPIIRELDGAINKAKDARRLSARGKPRRKR